MGPGLVRRGVDALGVGRELVESARHIGVAASVGGVFLDGMRLLLSSQREQPLAKSLAGSMQPDLGVGLGDAQLRGDGFVWQVVDVAQHDNGAQRCRQLVEGFGDPDTIGGHVGPRLRIDLGPHVDERRIVIEGLVTVPAPLGQKRRGAVRGDAVQPGRERCVAAEVFRLRKALR